MARSGTFRNNEGETIEIARDDVQETIEARAAQLAALADTEPDDQDELRALAEIDSGGDVTFQVWRMLPITEKGFVMELSAAELTVKKIQEDCGKGRYRIRGIRTNGTYAGQRTIDIAVGAKSPSVASPEARSDGFTDYVSHLEEREAKRAESMRSWAMILVPALAPVFANLFGQKGPSLADLTTSLANMKALQGGDKSSVETLKEMAAMMTIMRDMTPEKETGSTWVDLIRDGVKELPAILPGIAAMRPNAAPGIVTATVAAVPPLKVEQKEANPMMQLLAWLKDQLNGLTHQASLNKDPALYAEVVVDNIPTGTDIKMLREYLARADWWTILTQISPQVQPYPQWFAECREEIVKNLDGLMKEIAQATGQPPMPSDE